MAYIWVNPVAAGMYEEEALNDFLQRHGYKRFYTSTDWIGAVREKYKVAVEREAGTVMDVRCPKVKEVLMNMKLDGTVTIPEIHPILIHCGKEASEQEALVDEEKIITTPCQALADMGNALGLRDTRFVTWNQFVERLDDEPERRLAKESPIPPGFFAELGLKTDSVTGEEELRSYFRKGVPKDVQLVEMLFCKDGCHNGDGIIKCQL